jgi:hypothetical protein
MSNELSIVEASVESVCCTWHGFDVPPLPTKQKKTRLANFIHEHLASLVVAQPHLTINV